LVLVRELDERLGFGELIEQHTPARPGCVSRRAFQRHDRTGDMHIQRWAWAPPSRLRFNIIAFSL
jgi:hypothetical protein